MSSGEGLFKKKVTSEGAKEGGTGHGHNCSTLCTCIKISQRNPLFSIVYTNPENLGMESYGQKVTEEKIHQQSVLRKFTGEN